MRSTPWLLGILLASSPALADEAPIIGGTATTVGQYPSVVALQVGNGLCTGELIRPDWVLTAAHCVNPGVVGEPNQAAVTASTHVHFDTINVLQAAGKVVNASDTMWDPQFNINNLGSHDIGLIHLSAPVTDREPYDINLDMAMAPVGTIVTMVGFGATLQGAGGTVGKEFELKNRTSVGCATIGAGADADLLCFSQVDGKGKCEGDSGGPSFASINGKNVIVGVTSFGDQQCAQIGADTRVDAEKAWLVSKIPDLGGCTTDADCGMGKMCFQKKCIVQPFSTGGLGATCTTGTDCDSGQCASGDGGMKCSMGCMVGTADSCPSGFDCLGATGGAGACWPSSSGGGCCEAGNGGSGAALLALGLMGLVLRRRR